jgi:Rieske Fe-S protein
MSRSIPVCLIAFAAICASTVLASAQVTSSPTESNSIQAPAPPVAYVYVSSAPTSSTGQINGFAAASNGALTPLPGSPYQHDVNYMAVNGAWLFGVANMDTDIDSFSIGSNGALTLKDTYKVTNPGPGVISVYLDHTGSTLYADYYTTNNDYLSFNINQSTGQLTKVGDLPGGPPNNSPVSFIGNNVFAYSSSCYHFGAEIIGVKRNTDGTLSYLNYNFPVPAEKSGGFYCPWIAAADPTNHVAIAMQPMNSNFGTDGNFQLAVYTAGSTGNLTTKSTYSNMPSTLVGFPTDYRMSPSGKFLAVGGTLGLQIFHFNGANPITKFTARLTSSPIDQIFWDNANHVYAISYQAGKLFVWTVTSTGVTRAPGSPHTITNPQNLIVLPKS